MQAIDHASVNTLRFLAADQVEKAKSGHPGFPLGTAPLMYTLWDRFMHYNPKDPNWFNRDRFVLSPGHGSALLYAMLHLAGYDVSMEELKNFRQWGSKTPGHPEYGHTAGVDASTGPLGHGFAMGVGFAVAEAMLAAKYNKPVAVIVRDSNYNKLQDLVERLHIQQHIYHKENNIDSILQIRDDYDLCNMEIKKGIKDTHEYLKLCGF